MKVDISAQPDKIEFTEGESFSFDQLTEIIKTARLMQALSEGLSQQEIERLLGGKPEPEPDTAVDIKYVASQSRNTNYIVSRFRNGRVTCNCPDFVERHKEHTGETCKHIRFVMRTYGHPWR